MRMIMLGHPVNENRTRKKKKQEREGGGPS